MVVFLSIVSVFRRRQILPAAVFRKGLKEGFNR